MWNTVSARIRGATTELVDMGEETDEYVESTSKLRDLVKGYTGFDIMDDENNFKDLYEIVLGIGQAWGDMEDIQKAALGEALGGKRNARGLYSIFDHLDTLTSAYETSINSAGSAAREQEHYAESIQYSIDRTKASLEQLSVDFLSSDLLKGLIEGANTLLQIIDKIISSLGTIGTLLTGGGIASFVHGMATNKGLLAGLFGNLATRRTGSDGNSFLSNILATFTGSSAGRTIQKTGEGIAKNIGEGIERRGGYSIGDAVTNALAAGFTREVIPYGDGDFVEVWRNRAGEIVQQTQGATQALDASLVQSATQSGTTAGTGFASAFASAITAHPLIASAIGIGVAAAVTAGIVAGVNKYQKEQRAKKGRATIESYEETKSQVEGYQERYITLKEGLDNAKTDADRLSYREQILSLQQEIVAQYGSEASAVDLVNGKLSEQVGIIGEIANSQMEKNMQDSDFRKYLKESTKEMESEGQFEVGVIVRDGTAPELEKDIDQIIERLQGEYGEDAIELSPTFSPTVDGEIETDTFTISGTKYQAKQIQDSLKSELERLSESYKGDEVSSAIIDNLLNGFSAKLDESFTDYGSGYLTDMYQNKMLKPQQELYDDYVESIRNLNLAFASGDDDTINQAIDAYAGYSDRIGTELKDFKPLTEKAYEQLDETSLKAHDLKEAISSDNVSQNNMFKDNIDDIKKYADVIEDANFSTQDIAEIFANPKVMTKKGQTALIELAKSMGILGEDITADNNILPTYIDLLSELGIAVEGASDKTKDATQDFSAFQSSIINDIANIDTLNAAIAESVNGKGLSYSIDENGELVGSMATIKAAYQDLMDGTESQALFERTANGIHVNQEKLRELKSELQASKIKEFTEQETNLLKEQQDIRSKINSLTANGVNEDNASDLSTLQSQLDAVGEKIGNLKDLRSAWEGATSAYQQWVESQSAGEEGDMYNTIRDTALKRGEELWTAGLTGTNEFRAIAQMLSNEDLTTAPIEKIEAAYQNGSKAVKQFFTDDVDGLLKFSETVQAMGDEVGYVSETDDAYNFFGIDMDAVAEKLGVSRDIVDAIFRRFSDYGYNTRFFDEDQVEELQKIKQGVDEVQSALKDSADFSVEFGDGSQKSFSDIIDFDFVEIGEDADALNAKLAELQTARADPDINSDQAKLLDELIQLCIQDLDILNGYHASPDGPNLETWETAQTLLQGFEEEMQKLDEANVDPKINLTIEDSPEAMKIVDMFMNDPDLALMAHIDISKGRDDVIRQLEEMHTNGVDVSANVDSGNVQEEVGSAVSGASGTPDVNVDEGNVTSQTEEGIKNADGTTVTPSVDAGNVQSETEGALENATNKTYKANVSVNKQSISQQMRAAFIKSTPKTLSDTKTTNTVVTKETKETDIKTEVSGNAEADLTKLQSMASKPMDVKINIDTNADVAVAKLQSIANTKLEGKVKISVEDSEVKSWKAPDKTGMVKYFVNGGNVSAWSPPEKQGYVRYNVTGTSPVYTWRAPEKTGIVRYSSVGPANGTAHWQGTAGGYYSPKRHGSVGNSFINHYNGTAYARGNWGLKRDEPNALINELG